MDGFPVESHRVKELFLSRDHLIKVFVCVEVERGLYISWAGVSRMATCDEAAQAVQEASGGSGNSQPCCGSLTRPN